MFRTAHKSNVKRFHNHFRPGVFANFLLASLSSFSGKHTRLDSSRSTCSQESQFHFLSDHWFCSHRRCNFCKCVRNHNRDAARSLLDFCWRRVNNKTTLPHIRNDFALSFLLSKDSPSDTHPDVETIGKIVGGDRPSLGQILVDSR